jgi:predicted NUDIX family phosphoesterase
MNKRVDEEIFKFKNDHLQLKKDYEIKIKNKKVIQVNTERLIENENKLKKELEEKKIKINRIIKNNREIKELYLKNENLNSILKKDIGCLINYKIEFNDLKIKNEELEESLKNLKVNEIEKKINTTIKFVSNVNLIESYF